jgi:hypothetical protein
MGFVAVDSIPDHGPPKRGSPVIAAIELSSPTPRRAHTTVARLASDILHLSRSRLLFDGEAKEKQGHDAK